MSPTVRNEMSHRGTHLRRLTPQELMMLRAEDAGWREDIGAIAIVEGDRLFDATGELRLDRIRDRIAERLHLLPRFRQIVRVPPWWSGRPVWIDAPDFDVRQHVRSVRLPEGAGEAELLAQVERIRARPFDAQRPLWELWAFPGLPDGRVGLYIKLHHSLADGVAGVAQVVLLLDLDPDAPPDRGPRWRPDPLPSTYELFVENVSDLRGHAARWLRSAMRHPAQFGHDFTRSVRSLRDTIGQPKASATSVNQVIGDERILRLVRNRLDDVKAIGRAHDATVNDVLMAVVAGGYRELLRHRGEDLDVELRCSVPVSLHEEDVTGELTNDDGMMFVPLSVGTEDVGRRLEVLSSVTPELKRHVLRPPASVLTSARVLQDQLWKHFARQRWSNAYVANVPGSPQPLYLVGARILEVFPVVPIMGNLCIGVGAMSYDDQLNVTVVADRATCPDVDVFVEGMLADLRELSRSLSS